MTWKTFSSPTVIQSLKGHLAVWMALSITSCVHGGPIPEWNGEIWPGDHTLGGVTRKDDVPGQTDPVVRILLATDPQFDKGFWMTYADFRSFYATYVLGCKQWNKGLPMMTAQEALARFRPVVEDMQREAQLENSPKPVK